MSEKDDLFLIQVRLFRLAQFIKSETARILFDQDTGMWLNGLDYIADEYK